MKKRLLLFLSVFHLGLSLDLPDTCQPLSELNMLRKGTWSCPCEPLELTRGDASRKTVISMAVPGRLGNRMFVFALMLAFKRVFGLRAYLQSNVLEDVNHYFPRATQIPSIENNFCMPPPKLDHLYPRLQQLNISAFSHGHTMQYWPNLRLMDSIVNEDMKLLDVMKEVEPELRKTFVFKKDIQYYTRNIIRNAIDSYKEHILKTRKKKLKNLHKINITLVGVHVRKRDSDRDIVDRYSLPRLSSSYYLEAMHMYQKRFKHVVFVVVSDEMRWVTENLMPRKGSAFIFPAGLGHVNCRTSIAVDLAILAACHHTILSYGTFSFWGGWLSGGHRVLPNHIFRVTNMEDPFEGTLDSFRLPDMGTFGLSKNQKVARGRGSFEDLH